MATAADKYSIDVQREMENFSQLPEKERPTQLSGSIKRAIEITASTGISYYPWQNCLQAVIAHAIARCATGVNSQFPDCPDLPGLTFDEQLDQIVDYVEGFEEAPFTIQRICELLVRPDVYRSSRKYLGALDKLVTVSTTLPHCKPGEEKYYGDLVEEGAMDGGVFASMSSGSMGGVPEPVDPSTLPKDSLDVMDGIKPVSVEEADNKMDTE